MRALYDSKSKTMDDRGIKELFSDKAKYQTWLMFEAALAQAQAEEGFIPEQAAKDIQQARKIHFEQFKYQHYLFEDLSLRYQV